jgi:hypothetical protein
VHACLDWCDQWRLLDATPVPCGTSRETVKRSELAGWAGYGWDASHHRCHRAAACARRTSAAAAKPSPRP